MLFRVIYDTQSEDEHFGLSPSDVPLLNVAPFKIENGYVATYEFDASVSGQDLFDAVERSNWCFLSAQVLEAV